MYTMYSDNLLKGSEYHKSLRPYTDKLEQWGPRD